MANILSMSHVMVEGIRYYNRLIKGGHKELSAPPQAYMVKILPLYHIMPLRVFVLFFVVFACSNFLS